MVSVLFDLARPTLGIPRQESPLCRGAVLMFFLPELHPRLARARKFVVPAVLLIAIILTMGTWVGVTSQLRRIAQQLVLLPVIGLALAGLGRLRLPRWSLPVVTGILALSCEFAYAVKRIKRKCMGIEPTGPALNARPSGFEDRGRHQACRHFRNDDSGKRPSYGAVYAQSRPVSSRMRSSYLPSKPPIMSHRSWRRTSMSPC